MVILTSHFNPAYQSAHEDDGVPFGFAESKALIKDEVADGGYNYALAEALEGDGDDDDDGDYDYAPAAWGMPKP